MVSANINLDTVISSDSSGNSKTSFLTTEDVYAHIGTHGGGSQQVRLYVVASYLPQGSNLTDVSGGYETVTVTGNQTFSVWNASTTTGTYYIVLDENRNGKYGDNDLVSPAFTINKVTSAIVTAFNVTSPITVGTPFKDTATLSGYVSGYSMAGTISFYWSTDHVTWILLSSVAAPTTGGPVSANAPALGAGTYYFKANYTGNANYTSATSGATAEVITINPATPSVTTSLNATSITLGEAIYDSATVTGLGDGYPIPTGSVQFQNNDTGIWLTEWPPQWSSLRCTQGASSSLQSTAVMATTQPLRASQRLRS